MNDRVKAILERAKTYPKGNYMVYNQLKNEIYNASETPEEAQKATMKLIKILKV